MRSITRKKTPGIHRLFLSIAASVLILALTAQPASAFSTVDTQKKPLSPEQILNRYRLSSPLLSPDVSCVAFVLSDPLKGTSSKSNIYIYKIKDKALIQFTNSTKSDRHPRWSPDSRTLAFLSSRSDKTQIYLIPIDGGEALALTESKTGIRSFEWSPDGKRIAFLSTQPKTEEEEKKQKDKDDALVVDRDKKHALLRIIDVDSREIRDLTGEKWRISSFTWTPDGKQLIISATNHPQPELLTEKIYSIEAGGGKMHEIAAPNGPFNNIKVAPGGKAISYIGSRTDGPSAHDLFLLPLSGGKARNLTAAAINRPIASYSWKKDGAVLVSCLTGVARTFYSVSTDGKVKKHKNFKVQPGSFTTADNTIAFVGETSTTAPELWISTDYCAAEKITSFNKEWDKIELIRPEILKYKSFDGKEIEAVFLRPKGFRQETKVPLVVLVHGGPTGVWSDRFNSWGQLLAARGFAVLCPNIRGSIGYGHKFMVANRRDWGGGDYKDVLAGVDFMVEQGIADPDRLGIGGWSYGGYMAAWAVTQTERFKASVSGAPMTDLAVEYGAETNSINAYDTWFMGTPYENLDLFIERSPMTYVKNVKTPTLILCGENDAIDPVAQCYQFHRGLKRYNVTTDLVIYPREGHGLREEKHRIDMMNRMIDWFSKHIKVKTPGE